MMYDGHGKPGIKFSGQSVGRRMQESIYRVVGASMPTFGYNVKNQKNEMQYDCRIFFIC